MHRTLEIAPGNVLVKDLEASATTGEFLAIQLPSGRKVVVVPDDDFLLTICQAFQDPELLTLLRDSSIDFDRQQGLVVAEGERPFDSRRVLEGDDIAASLEDGVRDFAAGHGTVLAKGQRPARDLT